MAISDGTSRYELFLEVVRAEEQRRSSLLRDMDPEDAGDYWFTHDLPFLNDLCLLVFVLLRHRVERRLIYLAACAGHAGHPMNRATYLAEREGLRLPTGGTNWTKVHQRLDTSSNRYKHVAKTLRLLANAYKHDASNTPSDDLKTDLPLV